MHQNFRSLWIYHERFFLFSRFYEKGDTACSGTETELRTDRRGVRNVLSHV